MCLLAEFGGKRSCQHRNINYYINFCMNTSERTELTTSLRHIERFPKSGIPIYNSKVSRTADRKTTMTRTQAIAKRYGFYENAINLAYNKYNNFHSHNLSLQKIYWIHFIPCFIKYQQNTGTNELGFT